MRIALNTYSPAFTDNVMLSSATGLWLRDAITPMVRAGHEILNVSVGGVSNRDEEFERAFAKKVDAMILIWRWPMDEDQYPRRSQAYERQLELIDLAIDHGIPVLIHDEDYKPGAIEAFELLKMNNVPVNLTAPAMFSPNHNFLPFPKPDGMLMTRVTKEFDFGYIGNNYERYEQMKKWFKYPPIDFHSIHILGNWLSPSPNRESPEQVKADFPNIYFGSQVPQNMVIKQLAKYRFTCHFAKDEYCSTGFITMRWLEAVMAGTVAFIPTEFKLPTWMKPAFQFPDPYELLNQEFYDHIRNKQAEAVAHIFNSGNWLAAINALVNQ